MFSALSSFLIMRIQRSNLLESVRPELVLIGWYRAPAREPFPETIAFRKVKNVGRGVALHIRLHAHEHVGDLPTATLNSMAIPLIAAGDDVTVEGIIHVWFKNVPRIGETRALGITVLVSCVDSRGNYYDTEHNLIVVEGATFLTDQIADGVTLSRTTTMTPAWRIRLRARRNRFLIRIGGIPLIGRLALRKR
jgi:hypothetical protein